MTDTAPSGRGNFFAVDWRCAEAATRAGDGVNPALAYLVLARHTGRNHATTTAATTAVSERLGLTRGRADLAIKALEGVGLVTTPKKGTLRTLTPWAGVQAEREKLTDRQRAVVGRVLGKRDPILSSADPDYQVAYALKQRGILDLSDGKPGKSRFKVGGPEWIWLPNTLTDGFGQGDGPLARLRQTRSAEAIRLLLNCYRFANLAEDGGLPWRALRRTYKRQEIYRHGAFTVWGFVRGSMAAEWEPLFGHLREALGQDEGSKAIWGLVDALKDAGLIEEVGHIVEGLDASAQAIHAYALPGEGEPEERRVQEAAHAAGRRCLTDERYLRAGDDFGSSPWLCPVRSHITSVELVGIIRPKHRPHTKLTAAWRANFLSDCADHADLFDNLCPSSIRSTG